MSVLKFMSNRITSGWKALTVLISWAGDGRISTASNRIGNRIFNADRIPALSSTTSTFPTFFIFIGLDYSETDSATVMFSAPVAFKAATRASTWDLLSNGPIVNTTAPPSTLLIRSLSE